MAAQAEALEAAHRATAAGDWATARSSFETALRAGESAEALAGLGNVLWWLGDTEGSVRCLERAYAGFRQRPELEQAALTGVYLCLLYRASLGNFAASRGWLARAARLVEDHALTGLAGWILLCRAVAANDEHDHAAAERWATEARRAAGGAGDADLELCALSELGAALVGMGRLDAGAALLDEAMAGSLGGDAASPDTVVLTSCNTVVSCSRSGDFKRARQWVQAADAFNRRYGSPHLYTVCRVHYGSVLLACGSWAEAERELLAALEIGRRAEPALHAEALGRLAELRLAQNRLEEAGRLLDGLADHPAAVRAVAAVALARGHPAVAATVAGRRLRDLPDESPEAAALLDLLVEAELRLGPPGPASARAERLAAAGAPDGLAGPAARAAGRARLTARDEEAAVRLLERALAAFGRLEMPYESARTRVLLSRALLPASPEAAVAEAREALAAFERLGAARDADVAAAFLRERGIRAARAGPRARGELTAREREVLRLLGDGLSNPDIAERLVISRKTVEHHVASVLSKLGLRGRGEAAAYAVRHLDTAHPSVPRDR